MRVAGGPECMPGQRAGQEWARLRSSMDGRGYAGPSFGELDPGTRLRLVYNKGFWEIVNSKQSTLCLNYDIGSKITPFQWAAHFTSVYALGKSSGSPDTLVADGGLTKGQYATKLVASCYGKLKVLRKVHLLPVRQVAGRALALARLNYGNARFLGSLISPGSCRQYKTLLHTYYEYCKAYARS
ncbi:hypothetical protein NDU88_006057 [Pleurodeles waltl]|uniref:Uncharacterized protein n=1 Tax=Pleurodeles waltl TaxID=8319 RepID=A0AAV7WWG9_PLEWA|nr:hypothetical protein NDU88_006057 [Pleurodeles waltl]